MIKMVRHGLGCQESLRKLHHGKSLRIILAAIIRNDLTIIDLDLEQENGLDDFFFLFLHDFQEIIKKKELNLDGSVLPNVPSPLSRGIFY